MSEYRAMGRDNRPAECRRDPTATTPVYRGGCASRVGDLSFLVSGSQRILHLTFSKEGHGLAVRRLAALWPGGTRISRDATMEQWLSKRIEVLLNAATPPLTVPIDPLFLAVGTPFQRAVWRAIAGIPRNRTLTYKAVAEQIGRPGACRAVGQACGANPLALIIPCHRVVGTRSLGGFAGGIAVKRQLLAME